MWNLGWLVMLSHVFVSVKVTLHVNSPAIPMNNHREWRFRFWVYQLIVVRHKLV
jgi:hypothetical protein